jgi:hypothetical protein
MRLCGSLVVLVLTGMMSGRGWAETRCPGPTGGDEVVAAMDGVLRLHWIDRRLSTTAHQAQVWTWGWGTGIVAATVANLAPLPYVAKENRIDWYVGAGTTIVGLVPFLVAPLDVLTDGPQLRAAVSTQLNEETVCRLLADAETKLIRNAKNQEDCQRWWWHAANVAFNTGIGLFLGLGYDLWGMAALNIVGGTVMGEAILLTQPTGSIVDLHRYRMGALDDN